MADLCNQLAVEALGTVLPFAIATGSGIMAEHLAGGNVTVVLLANTAATVGSLYILIEAFGPINSVHFNPAVCAIMAARTELSGSALVPYIAAQLVGTVLGAWLAHAMFDMTILQFSTRVRSEPGQWVARAVATARLLLVILHAPNGRVSSIVVAHIGTAYWFTVFTSFTNPAAALGHMLSSSFAGIAPSSMPDFVLTECAGTVLGLILHRILEPHLVCHGHPNIIEPSGEHPAD